MDQSQSSQQAFTCSTCRLRLATVDAQRAHFQTPLHAFNVRRKIVNMVPVSQAQFDERVVAAETEQRAAASVKEATVSLSKLFLQPGPHGAACAGNAGCNGHRCAPRDCDGSRRWCVLCAVAHGLLGSLAHRSAPCVASRMLAPTRWNSI